MPRWHHSDSSSERYQEVKSIKKFYAAHISRSQAKSMFGNWTNSGFIQKIMMGKSICYSWVNHITLLFFFFFTGNWSVRCGNNDHFDKGEKAIYTVGLCGAHPPALYDTSAGSVTRTYYIGVVEDEWHYSPYHTIHPITEEDYSVPGS